ncbi:MAG: hypothetical protein HWD85_00605 [Flavobacteriaceae bacterium]|nr:hypothetical protein [Flavobacteriaceae bacterium]
MLKRVHLFLNIFLFTSVMAYGQFYKGTCIIDYRININDPMLLSNYLFSDNFQNKWNETIIDLHETLSGISISNKKFGIRKDTLQIVEKTSVRGKVKYITSKFPLKQLVNVAFSSNELVIYTKWKNIVVERYQHKKLKTSQIIVIKQFKKEKYAELISLLNKIKEMNAKRVKL